MIQYWRSSEDLLSYAKNEKHLRAWKNFNKKVGNNDSVGIYHETYQVKNGDYESVYGNMPIYGFRKSIEAYSYYRKTKFRSKTAYYDWG